MIHEKLMYMILDSLKNNIIIKDKYDLKIDCKNSSLTAYKFSDNRIYKYKVIQKSNGYQNIVCFDKNDFDKYDYFIIIDNDLPVSVFDYSGFVCRIVHIDTLKVNFNNGFYDMCNGKYAMTRHFINNCEELRSINL